MVLDGQNDGNKISEENKPASVMLTCFVWILNHDYMCMVIILLVNNLIWRETHSRSFVTLARSWTQNEIISILERNASQPITKLQELSNDYSRNKLVSTEN